MAVLISRKPMGTPGTETGLGGHPMHRTSDRQTRLEPNWERRLGLGRNSLMARRAIWGSMRRMGNIAGVCQGSRLPVLMGKSTTAARRARL